MPLKASVPAPILARPPVPLSELATAKVLAALAMSKPPLNELALRTSEPMPVRLVPVTCKVPPEMFSAAVAPPMFAALEMLSSPPLIVVPPV